MRNRALAAMLGIFGLRQFTAAQAARTAAVAHETAEVALGNLPRVMPPARRDRTGKQVVCTVCGRGEGTLRRISALRGPGATYAHVSHDA